MAVFGKKSLNPGDPIQDGGPGRRRIQCAGGKLRDQWFRRHRHRRLQLQAGRRDDQLCGRHRHHRHGDQPYRAHRHSAIRVHRRHGGRERRQRPRRRPLLLFTQSRPLDRERRRRSALRPVRLAGRTQSERVLQHQALSRGQFGRARGGRRSAASTSIPSAGRRDGFRRSVSIPSSICRTIRTWRRPASIRSSTFSRSVATRAARPTCRTSPSSARAGSTTPTISCKIRMSRQPESTRSSTS